MLQQYPHQNMIFAYLCPLYLFIYTCVFLQNLRKFFKFMFFFSISQKYAKYVGLKRDFRLVVRGAARNMVAILNGSGRFCSPFFEKEE